MVFLVLGILEVIATIVIFILSLVSGSFNVITLIELAVMILNCIIMFTLYGMRSDINANREEISSLYKAVNQCRKKLNLQPVEENESEEEQAFKGENKAKKNECPACFHKISKGDTECSYCGYKLK